MLEIRGIADYKKYSFSEKPVQNEENQDAEFQQLMTSGQGEKDTQGLSEIQSGIIEAQNSGTGIETVMYSGVGMKRSDGGSLGRIIDVKI
jgi:hypothetical protein